MEETRVCTRCFFFGCNKQTNVWNHVFRKTQEAEELSVTRWRKITALWKKYISVCREPDGRRNRGGSVWHWHICLLFCLLFFSFNFLFSLSMELRKGKAKESYTSNSKGQFLQLLNREFKCRYHTLFSFVQFLGFKLSSCQVNCFIISRKRALMSRNNEKTNSDSSCYNVFFFWDQKLQKINYLDTLP